MKLNFLKYLAYYFGFNIAAVRCWLRDSEIEAKHFKKLMGIVQKLLPMKACRLFTSADNGSGVSAYPSPTTTIAT